jgi:hypothetical protein
MYHLIYYPLIGNLLLRTGAWFIYKRRKMVKEEGLALTSSVSAFLGVTEPAMNLGKY